VALVVDAFAGAAAGAARTALPTFIAGAEGERALVVGVAHAVATLRAIRAGLPVFLAGRPISAARVSVAITVASVAVAACVSVAITAASVAVAARVSVPAVRVAIAPAGVSVAAGVAVSGSAAIVVRIAVSASSAVIGELASLRAAVSAATVEGDHEGQRQTKREPSGRNSHGSIGGGWELLG